VATGCQLAVLVAVASATSAVPSPEKAFHVIDQRFCLMLCCYDLIKLAEDSFTAG
jgi:hypothetical protein